MLTQDNEENRKVLNGLYYDLKIVLDLIFDIEKKLQYPSFYPGGADEYELSLLEDLRGYEKHLIFKIAEAKGLFKPTIMN
jgi:hypothetical protein